METLTLNTPEAPASTVSRRYVRPRAITSESADGYTIELEMPGVQSTGLEVTFENGELTVIGHRATPDGHEVVYRESNGASYRRVFELDATVDSGRIAARLDRGILILTLPKSEASKPRRIEIGGAN